MAIDFPDTPVDGNTYTYNDVTYTYLQPSPPVDGYWTVLTPATVSPATVLEVNEGTELVKYVTPFNLNGSKYVREDEVSGETTLDHSSAERLKTTAQGVEVTGQFKLGSGLQQNDGTDIPYIVEKGNDGTSRQYRLWSDGYYEEWGATSAFPGSGFITTLFKTIPDLSSASLMVMHNGTGIVNTVASFTSGNVFLAYTDSGSQINVWYSVKAYLNP